MGRKYFTKKNTPKTDFSKLRGRFLANSKFGKTGLVEGINRYYDDEIDKFAIFSVGIEDGTSGIAATSEEAYSWDLFVQMIDDIVDNVEDYKKDGIEAFVFDTENQLIQLAENVAIDTYNKERDPQKNKKAKTINAAFGGFQKGQDYAANLIMEQLNRVYKAGFGTIQYGYVKKKDVKNKITENTTEKVTSDLLPKYNNAFEAFCDYVVVAYFNEIFDEETDEIIRMDRVLSLSPKDTDSENSGARFVGLPEKIILETYEDNSTPQEMYDTNMRNGALFVKTFEEALKINADLRNNKKTSKSKKTTISKKAEKKVEVGIEEDASNDLLVGEELVNALRDAGKEDKKIFTKMTELIVGDEDVSLKEIARMIKDEEIDEIAIKDLNELL